MNLRKAKFRVGIEQINRGWRSPKLVQGLDSLRFVFPEPASAGGL